MLASNHAGDRERASTQAPHPQRCVPTSYSNNKVYQPALHLAAPERIHASTIHASTHPRFHASTLPTLPASAPLPLCPSAPLTLARPLLRIRARSTVARRLASKSSPPSTLGVSLSCPACVRARAPWPSRARIVGSKEATLALDGLLHRSSPTHAQPLPYPGSHPSSPYCATSAQGPAAVPIDFVPSQHYLHTAPRRHVPSRPSSSHRPSDSYLNQTHPDIRADPKRLPPASARTLLSSSLPASTDARPRPIRLCRH